MFLNVDELIIENNAWPMCLASREIFYFSLIEHLNNVEIQ
jgi:hypothetical protein